MKTQTDTTKPRRAVRWQAVALPAEHGSWSLVAEPILLGLLVAPTWGGLAWALAAFAAFLTYQPLKVVWTDRRRGRWYGRTALAARISLLYALTTAVFAAAALWLAGPMPLLPFLLALPLLGVFLFYDQKPGRHWQAELAAPTAFAAVAGIIALAGGWAPVPALALWFVMLARSVPAVLYVRAWLRLAKGKPAQRALALAAHALALAGVGLLVNMALLPATAVVAVAILLGRAAWGLARPHPDISTKALGFLETGFGLLTAVLVAAGYWLG